MRLALLRRSAPALAAGLMAATLIAGALPAGAAPFDGRRDQFADQGFATAWARTDNEAVRGGRTWYWGPGPWLDYAEFYRQGQNGLRTVQYFDKARMELNNPADRSGANAGVTNGLLVKELVSGRMQLGNDPFDTDQRPAADVPVAGNPRDANPNAPGYANFQGVATLDNGYKDPQRLGQRIGTTIDRGGNLGQRPELALPETEITVYNSVTGHNIPRVFWEFLGQQGPIYSGGRVGRGPVVDWLFAMGYPLTDAYWTRAQIGGSEQDVLVQLFERRVLTYVPANPAGYKVEMGNVGQHYFQWRYPHLGTPWTGQPITNDIVYASDKDTGNHWELYRVVGNTSFRMTSSSQETVAYSWRRSWDPGQIRLLGDTRRFDPKARQLFQLGPVAYYDGDNAWNNDAGPVATRPGGDGTRSNDYNAAYSPDGTKIVFVSDREGGQELFIMPAGANPVFPFKLTQGGCVNETPTWSPDGRRLYWASNCDGDFELYTAELAYDSDSLSGVYARLVNQRKLTDNGVDDRFARVSPDGTMVAYSTLNNGTWDLALVVSNGDPIGTLNVTPFNEEAPTWSPDSAQLAYASDATGSYQIYIVAIGRPGAAQQITNNPGQSRWPLWAQ
jgi:hypothetical protein